MSTFLWLSMCAFRLAVSRSRCHVAFLRSPGIHYSLAPRHAPVNVLLEQWYIPTVSSYRRSTSLSSTAGEQVDELPNDPRGRAAYAFAVLAKRDKSWQRFRHIVDLAVEYQNVCDDYGATRSILDVGTDHGLLATALAMTRNFDSVLGVDVSPNALDNSLRILPQVQERFGNMVFNEKNWRGTSSPGLSLMFRLSDGLENVEPQEADVVCIAGMGVNAMKKILQASTKEGNSDLDRVQCRQLILQPANARPRNLVQLYDMLHRSGWRLLDERIEFLSTRWYLTCCFVRSDAVRMNPAVTDNAFLPTSKLLVLDEEHPMKQITQDYIRHHLKWIQLDDTVSTGNIHEEDVRWRDFVDRSVSL